MNEDLFPTLPQEITIDILSRLQLRTITKCKCVCKSWRDLIEGSQFATSHLRKSKTGFVLVNDAESPKPYKICAYDQGTLPTLVSAFACPRKAGAYSEIVPHSSVNGLLLLIDKRYGSFIVFICNPITREYIEVAPPHPPPPPGGTSILTYGFGVSKISGQYKVVMIFCGCDGQPRCEVYTVGTGLWRSCSNINNRNYSLTTGLHFNGNLHWMSYVHRNDDLRISCFDIETEVFTLFAPPPSLVPCAFSNIPRVCALGDRLCLCDSPRDSDTIVIWSMNKYGDENSWGKVYIIKTPPPPSSFSKCRRSDIIPLKLFKEGEGGDYILLKDTYPDQLFLYSDKTKTIRKYAFHQLWNHLSSNIVLLTPSFVSLKTMGIQNVASF